jgi:hypothetical protein
MCQPWIIGMNTAIDHSTLLLSGCNTKTAILDRRAFSELAIGDWKVCCVVVECINMIVLTSLTAFHWIVISKGYG